MDTIKIYVCEEVDRHMDSLKRLAGSVIPSLGMPHRGLQWPAAAFVHQPSEGAIDYIAREMPRHLVARFDIALDLETTNHVDAEQLQIYLEGHLDQARQGKQSWVKKGGTLYSGQAGARNVIALYSDRSSKLTQRPCCHLEWRTSSIPAVRAAGVSDIRDLLLIDPRKFFEQRLVLRDFPETTNELVRFGNALLGQPKRKRPWTKVHTDGSETNIAVLAALTELRASANSNGQSAAAALHRVGRRHLRHFPRVATAWLLPRKGRLAWACY